MFVGDRNESMILEHEYININIKQTNIKKVRLLSVRLVGWDGLLVLDLFLFTFCKVH